MLEFDTFVNAFTYLSARLPRRLLLEPFAVEATVEPTKYVTSQVAMLGAAADQGGSLTLGIDFDLAASMMASLRLTSGRPPGDEVQPPVDVPLAESEPDMYPCMLAMCGSGIGFFKVGR